MQTLNKDKASTVLALFSIFTAIYIFPFYILYTLLSNSKQIFEGFPSGFPSVCHLVSEHIHYRDSPVCNCSLAL